MSASIDVRDADPALVGAAERRLLLALLSDAITVLHRTTGPTRPERR